MKLLLSFAALLVASTVSAQETGRVADEHRYGVGFTATFPSYGLSGMYDVSDQISAQAIIGALGTVSNVSGRVLHRFNQHPKYDVFGFGSAGMWFGGGASVAGVGGGGGVELN